MFYLIVMGLRLSHYAQDHRVKSCDLKTVNLTRICIYVKMNFYQYKNVSLVDMLPGCISFEYLLYISLV